MRASVIINTYNRASPLRQALQSLRLQTHGQFEVIVVNGPSTDHTDEVLAEFKGDIRVARCPEAHLCKSRNIGLAQASGDIVAYLDDDAVPEPHWLAGLMEHYDSDRIAGVGGLVYDHTGYTLQHCPLICTRRCQPRWDVAPPLWAFQQPLGDGFTHLMGGSSTFRRRCLVEVGGFDEQIEYFLDETELCMRLVDHGYWLRLVPERFVLHKFAPSHLRGENRVLRRPFPIVKNKFYVALRAARAGDDQRDILSHCQQFADDLSAGAAHARTQGLMTDEEFACFQKDVERAIWEGVAAGTHDTRRSVSVPTANPHAFQLFPILEPRSRRLNVCFVSQCIPPESPGGIGRFTLDLARGFAAAGHEVHLLAASDSHDRVDLEEGVWVHRLLPAKTGAWDKPELGPTVRHNLARAAAVHAETLRINRSSPVDLVSVPLWDTEGLFCLLDDSLTCVLSLQTSFQVFSELSPEWRSHPERLRLLSLERAAVRAARNVHAISASILRRVGADCNVALEPARAFVAPLGIVDQAKNYQPAERTDRVRVLFASRLERRKGVDVFLDAALALIQEFPYVDFYLAGKDTLSWDGGLPIRAQFEERHGEACNGRIRFLGEVPENELYQLYADCDIFCLPARYESFGLAYVEAMMFGKPVVGCRAGGMTEVVEHGVNGYLVDPDDADALVWNLRRLIGNEPLRRRFGQRSRARYEEQFTAPLMVENTLRRYTEIVERSFVE